MYGCRQLIVLEIQFTMFFNPFSHEFRFSQLFGMVPPRLCPYMMCHTTGPAHVCAPTRLCPDTFEPRHDCAQLFTCLCPHKAYCAQTRLCPISLVTMCPMVVPRRNCLPTITVFNRYLNIHNAPSMPIANLVFVSVFGL